MPLLTRLDIQNFRPFERLTVEGLTRVNLVVGRNNSGKTALLEAVEALSGEGALAPVLAGSRRRRETDAPDGPARSSSLDISHLFRMHELKGGSRFDISGRLGDSPISLSWRIDAVAEVAIDRQLKFPAAAVVNPGGLALFINDTAGAPAAATLYPLEEEGTLDSNWLRRDAELRRERRATRWIPANGLTAAALRQIWDRIALTAEAQRAIASASIIVDGLEGVHFTETGGWAKLSSVERKVPLGSLGEGTIRLLGLAMCLAGSPGGWLLADEIDVGLHWSVITDMWRLVIETARRLDLQVFATTHSLDCVNALGWLVQEDAALAAEVSLHRLERGYDHTTPFTAQEIASAAEYHSELR